MSTVEQRSDVALKALLAEEPLQAPPPAPRTVSLRRDPAGWAKQNLFRDAKSIVLTIVFAVVLAYVVYRAAVFVFVSGRWDLARVELLSFMVGTQFPRDPASLQKLWIALALVAAPVGLQLGIAARRAGTTLLEAFRVTWPILLVGTVLLALTQTATPKLLGVGLLALVVALRFVGSRLPASVARRVPLLWGLVGVALIAVLLPYSIGLDGPVAGSTLVVGGVALVVGVGAVLASRARPALDEALGPVQGVAFTVLGFLLLQNLLHIDLRAVDDWGGLLLTVYVAVAGIVLSFPLGVLLALGRTSSFALIRPLCVGYIELIRGVPLITLLFTGDLVLRFFLPAGTDPPGKIMRAVIMITLFTGAYTAEVVRGGLQSVPRGQYEAAKAIGLSPTKTLRLIVLPQALRNVIPALVGQFISLLKDTSLLVIIGVNELLGIANIVTSQTQFRSQGLIAEALAFVGLIYWCLCYSMSRASQRLETRLGVGTR